MSEGHCLSEGGISSEVRDMNTLKTMKGVGRQKIVSDLMLGDSLLDWGMVGLVGRN